MNNIQLSCTINEQLSTHYLIYKIVNNINEKYYIGQHQTNNIYDDYMGSGVYIKRAILEYGIENFTKIILYDFSSFEEMNNKEFELVQLSNCYPYDERSYNIIPGGNQLKLTKEMYKRRGLIYSKNYWNKSEYEHQKYKNECKKRAIRREQNKTNEQREHAHQKQKETWANKSYEQIQEGVSKWRESVNLRTEIQRKDITAKRLNTLNKRSDKEKELTKIKFTNTISNRSEERKHEIGKKHSDKLKQYYKKHPEQANKHSQRMKGSGNPAFGRRWMNNGVEVVYVKCDDINRYIENGYKFGQKIG